MTFHKKSAMIFILLLSIVFALGVGCQKTNQGKQTSAQILTIGLDKNVETLDILKTPAPLVWYPGHQITEALVIPDENMKPKPLLAESWERIDDVTWEFKLRKDVKFHDGTPFNAEAAKFSLERQQEEGPKWTCAPIDSISIEDDYTIIIKTDEPFSPLLEWLMNPVAAMVSPVAVEKHQDKFGYYVCGTGPFKIEKFIPEQETVLVRNDEYWGKKPILQKIVYKVITDPNTRVMALQAGEVDVIRDIQAPDVASLEGKQGFKVMKTPGVRTHYFGFNMKKKHFQDLRVRQAFNYAIDKEAIVNNIMHGIGQSARALVSPTMPGHLDINGYSYDPQKARDLLKEAKWSEIGGTIDVIVQPWANFWKPAAEALQAQLKEIGVNSNIDVMERGAFYDAVNKGEFDLRIDCTPAVHGGADYQLMSRFHPSFEEGTHASPGYVNTRVIEILTLARTEKDDNKRAEMYREVQKIVHEEAALIPFAYDVETVAFNEKVNGFKPHPSVWAVDLKTVSIE